MSGDEYDYFLDEIIEENVHLCDTCLCYIGFHRNAVDGVSFDRDAKDGTYHCPFCRHECFEITGSGELGDDDWEIMIGPDE